MLDNKYSQRRNKRAQISETMTWVIAILIIIFILTSSVFLSSQIARVKKTVSVGDLSLKKVSSNDLFLQQSIFVFYQKNLEEREKIYDILKKLESEGNFRNDLEVEINKMAKNLGEK
jgi:heme/copper-type cytochrome/quinol oxidase subunit 2